MLGLFNLSQAQDIVKGKVYELDDQGNQVPLFMVNVYWAGTNYGTQTNTDGVFSVATIPSTNDLVFSFVGMVSDTVCMDHVSDLSNIQVVLKPDGLLDEVEIEVIRKSTEISLINPIKFEFSSEAEIEKAACCNLSESFETNPSVDVAFADAVTGTRQIQMLGLSGPNIQITREGIPYIRGLASNLGLTFIPGTSLEGIQLNKGAGSVVNGYESIAGQINVELRKPESADKWFVNLFTNQGGRFEVNLNRSFKINQKTSSLIMLHGKMNQIKFDNNDDGFMDMPLSQNFIGLNRWKFHFKNGWEAQTGINYVYMDNVGGQMDFNPDEPNQMPLQWGMRNRINRVDGWIKGGKVLKKKGFSVGNQFYVSRHAQSALFGVNNYEATQNSLYYNFLLQGIIGNTNHKYFLGASIQYDEYEEQLNQKNLDRMECVPGAYFEYTFTRGERFNMVMGLRGDYHNYFGAFVTPRLHIRYAIQDDLVLRLAGGRGQRTVNLLSENMNLLASSREIVWDTYGDANNMYGLRPEVAWNAGGNIVKKFKLDYREGSISLDIYRTQFANQIIIDFDRSPQKVHIYNLDGKSYSNSAQIQLDYEVVKRLDMRLAYRYYDVKTTYNGQLLRKPLIASNRAFINLGYKTKSLWKFDATLNWQDSKRVPSTSSNPEGYQRPTASPAFYMVNGQIAKEFENKGVELYLGVENLFNFKQPNPIISAEEPFGDYFDSSLIWGPIFGRMVYAGVRWKIK